MNTRRSLKSFSTEKHIEELSALPADQPPDMVKVGEIFQRHAITIIAGPDAPHSPLA